MNKIQKLLSTTLLFVLLVLFQVTTLMPEALASSIDAMPTTTESVESSSSLQSRRCASDHLRSKFTELVNALPNGTRLSLSRPDRDKEDTKKVAICKGDFACDILAVACDKLGGVGQCGGDKNPNGCQCDF
jgi:hypothetical protein